MRVLPPFASLLLAALAVGVAACNPFAPDVEEGDVAGALGDVRTVDGFFTTFRAAYELRDSGLYEPLLDSAFTFVYYDYDAQVERAWGFARERETTRRLFEAAASIQLRYGVVLSGTETATEATVVRSFDLTVTLADDGTTLRTDGNVNFTLARADTTRPWRLVRWRDESEL